MTATASDASIPQPQPGPQEGPIIMITHYFSQSAGREIPIAGMSYSQLVNTINKRAREGGGGPDPMLDALRAELARRPPPIPPTEGERTAARETVRRDLAASAGHTLQRDEPNPRVALGGNFPPAETPDELKARLESEHAALLTAAGDLELDASALPKEVKTEEDVEAINQWVVKAKKVGREAEDHRERTKKPFLDAGRVVDGFFNSIGASVKNRMTAIEARKVPYLRAKTEAERQAREAEAARVRQAQQEALQRQQEERAEATRLANEASAALQALREATTPEEIAAAEEAYRVAARAAQLSDDAADQAAKDAKAAGKVVERQERILAGDHRHVLGRVSAGGASSTLKTVYKPDVHNRPRLLASLGPLAPYLSDSALEDALGRAARADPRPAIPGVDWIEDHQARTTVR